MKTTEEFYKEIEGSEELQKAIAEINDAASLEEFLKKHDCNATAKEFTAFVRSKTEGEMEDIDAALAAGGSNPSLERFSKINPREPV